MTFLEWLEMNQLRSDNAALKNTALKAINLLAERDIKLDLSAQEIALLDVALQLLNDQMAAVREENAELKIEINGMKETLATCNARVQKFESGHD